ncbi:hypothetical protein SAMN04488096_109146 [Mesonia phycicola]|uniref:Uncharacterized protein n=1 Tax=Mesonia phycicola TaxID=579105 RepID=A0A1M6H6B4_9FLAO|nr:hypothetical protein [Mesonia phycicola]SHJ17639.1 hypothetical protein SAMN04488096_109146 [Mesonia phycicola]
MKYLKYIILIFSIFFICSCNSLFIDLLTSKEVKTEVFYNQEKNKTLVLFPMVHINHPEFYDDTKSKLEKLRQQGYTVFFESIALKDSTVFNTQEMDTLTRKTRKISGIYMSDYKDQKNKSLPKAIRNSNYISQNRENLGFQEQDMIVDIPMNELIEIYEAKYGVIQLTQCDWETDYLEKYECETVPQVRANDVLIYTRNDTIEKRIYESKLKKIALVYGKKHFQFIRGGFMQNGYKEVDTLNLFNE